MLDLDGLPVGATLRLSSHLVGLGVSIADHFREQRRDRTMRAYAKANGYTYQAKSYGPSDTFTGGVFDRGSDRQARHLISGRESGRDFTLFDQTYQRVVTGTWDTTYTRTFYRSVIALPTGLAWTPRLEIAPENSLTRAVGVVRGNDIHVESDTFNRAFTVTCGDRKFASDVLHPQMLEAILTLDPRPWLVLDKGHLCLLHEAAARPGDLRVQVIGLAKVADRIPAFVTRDYTAPAVPRTGAATADITPPNGAGSTVLPVRGVLPVPPTTPR